jgi:hypothetical protein
MSRNPVPNDSEKVRILALYRLEGLPKDVKIIFEDYVDEDELLDD